MARPVKNGWEYFALACSITDRERFILAKGGPATFGVYIRLLQELFSVGGCFEFGPVEKTSFCFSNNLKEPELEKHLSVLFEADLFSEEVFEQTGFLTSRKIQKQFVLMLDEARRKSATLPECCLLLTPEEVPDNLYLRSNTESKVKESKVKEIRKNYEKSRKNRINPVITPNAAKELDKIPEQGYEILLFTPSERDKLETRYRENSLDLTEGFEILVAYSTQKKSKFPTYTSHYSVMIGWVLEEVRKRTTSRLNQMRSETYLKQAQNGNRKPTTAELNQQFVLERTKQTERKVN